MTRICRLWYVCMVVPAAILALPSAAGASGFAVLHSFAGGKDGSLPQAAPIADGAGNLYGTTFFGGAKDSGVAYKLAPDGTETILHAFGGKDGTNPAAGLLFDQKGNLYGTTYAGGAGREGTVFELAPGGTERVLYAFQSETDGENPSAEVISDDKGELYGTTDYGGEDSCSPGFGCGVVFRLSAKGKETVLHAFTGGGDGNLPSGGLLAGADGALYGVTAAGGGGSCMAGCGAVYRIANDGTETILYGFASNADGAGPYGTLVSDASGNLYGTTYAGGANGVGTVFKLTPHGRKTTLYAFANGSDGGYPASGLVMDGNGNLYGTTCQCADNNQFGNVFELTPDGKESALHVFKGGRDGADPDAGLFLAKGELYGTTFIGGHHNNGIVFSVKR